MKTCTTCKEEKPDEDFPKSTTYKPTGKVYRRKDCKKCHYSNPAGKRDRRKWHLKANYGISPEEYDTLYASQNGVCAICQSPGQPTGTDDPKTMLVVDHSHVTGLVRGLLCQTCNQGIGLLQDNKDFVLSAYRYLMDAET